MRMRVITLGDSGGGLVDVVARNRGKIAEVQLEINKLLEEL